MKAAILVTALIIITVFVCAARTEVPPDTALAEICQRASAEWLKRGGRVALATVDVGGCTNSSAPELRIRYAAGIPPSAIPANPNANELIRGVLAEIKAAERQYPMYITAYSDAPAFGDLWRSFLSSSTWRRRTDTIEYKPFGN